jgi:RND family efflux transporter MFP subunit
VIAVLLIIGGGVGLNALSSRIFKTEVDVTEIHMISPAQAAVQVTSTGYVVPQVTTKVGARVFGRVAEVLVHEGDRVEAGATLVRLDDGDQRTAIAGARARAAAARARLESSRANQGETQRQLDRERTLLASGAAARSVAEDLQDRLASLQATVDAARADADAAEAEVRQLELNLDYMTVTSPISGVITADPVQVGELVGPVTLEVVAEVADFTTLQVETDVPEGRLGLIRVGGPAEIVLDAFSSKRLRGRVVGVNPVVNRAKATVIVKVEFVDPTEGVLPEMSARVSFLSGELDPDAVREPPKLFVPGSAVVERGGQKVVFRVREGRAESEPVTIGAPIGEGFELLSGPPDGTKVIASPPDAIEDGYPISERMD